MSIAINRQLNLVVPLDRPDGTTLYVHSSPLGQPTFEVYFMVLAKTFSALAQNGLDPRSGPSVAALILKETAQNTARMPGQNWWDGHDGVGGPSGLLAEMVRLSNVCVPSPDGGGWTTMPLQQAFDRKTVDEEEKQEVLNLLTFFTVASRIAPRVDREKLIQGMSVIYELRTTYSNATDYATSLRTAKTEESSGESAPAA